MKAAHVFPLKKTLIVLSLLAGLSAPAAAATLNVVNLLDPKLVLQDDGKGLPEQPVLFSTHTARDQNVNNPGRVGDDIFLFDPTGKELAATNFLWGASNTTYNWSLTINGKKATFTLGNNSITSNVSLGNWNVIRFFLRANDTTRFTSSSVTVSTTKANGQDLTLPVTFTTTNSTFNSLNYALSGFQTITSLAGTMNFNFITKANAKQSPGDALSFDIIAAQVTPVLGVPVPAALPMSLSALALLGLVRRRRSAPRA